MGFHCANSSKRHCRWLTACSVDSFFTADAGHGDLGLNQTEANADFQRNVRKLLEDMFAIRISSRATDAEVQACAVSLIRGLAVQFGRDSFLEVRRKLLESKLGPQRN